MPVEIAQNILAPSSMADAALSHTLPQSFPQSGEEFLAANDSSLKETGGHGQIRQDAGGRQSCVGDRHNIEFQTRFVVLVRLVLEWLRIFGVHGLRA